MPELK